MSEIKWIKSYNDGVLTYQWRHYRIYKNGKSCYTASSYEPICTLGVYNRLGIAMCVAVSDFTENYIDNEIKEGYIEVKKNGKVLKAWQILYQKEIWETFLNEMRKPNSYPLRMEF